MTEKRPKTRPTARKRAAPATSRDMTQRYLDIAAVMILAYDVRGKVTLINKKGCEILGYPEEEIVGKRFESFVPKRLVAEAKTIVRRLMAGEMPPEEYNENPILTKSGEERLIAWHNTVLTDENGAITGHLSSGMDITGRKQAEERIAHLNHTLRAILNINQLITREKNRDALLKGVCENMVSCGCCTAVWVALLDESRELVTYSLAGFAGDFSPMIKILEQGDLPPCARRAFDQTEVFISRNPATACRGCPLQTVKVAPGSLAVRLTHGDRTYGIICAAVPVETLDSSDEVAPLFREVADDIAYALYNIDLAAQNELLERERFRSAKLESISTLAGGIAHDFNNLLTGIMGNVGLAKARAKADDELREMLDEAESAARRARALTQQLLTFAKGGKPVKKTVAIAGLIKESAEFALRGSSVRLELDFPGDLRPVEVDEGQFNQVIHNIVINADEAMPGGGVLRISAANQRLRDGSLPLPAGEYVRIDIADEGEGISPENLQRMFEPYFTTKPKGSGLGLSTVYSVIRNHGGYVTADSTPGQGTVFHIYLPASARPAPVAGDPPAGGQEGRKGGRILVMDDEPVIRKMLVNMLKVVGYEVEVTSEGAEALEAYRRALGEGRPFAAVIMDLTVPGGMGGKEAVGKLLEMDPDAKVIVSSGYATDAVMSEYAKYGFSAVIAKPYSIDQLEATLNSLPQRGS